MQVAMLYIWMWYLFAQKMYAKMHAKKMREKYDNFSNVSEINNIFTVYFYFLTFGDRL